MAYNLNQYFSKSSIFHMDDTISECGKENSNVRCSNETNAIQDAFVTSGISVTGKERNKTQSSSKKSLFSDKGTGSCQQQNGSQNDKPAMSKKLNNSINDLRKMDLSRNRSLHSHEKSVSQHDLDQYFPKSSIFRMDDICGINVTGKDGNKTQSFSKKSLFSEKNTNSCQQQNGYENNNLAMSKKLNSSTNDLHKVDSSRKRSLLTREKSISQHELDVQTPKDVVENTAKYSGKENKATFLQGFCKKVHNVKDKVKGIARTYEYPKLEGLPPRSPMSNSKYESLCTFNVESRNHRAIIGGICPLADGTCWVYLQDDRHVMRYCWTGEMKEHFKTHYKIDDMTIDDTSNMYLTCPSEKSIICIDKFRRESILYTLRMFPRGVAYHRQLNELLICRNSTHTACDLQSSSYNNIVRYSPGKQSVRQVNTQDMFKCPHRIQVNQGNGDIIISDFLNGIFVLDSRFKFRFNLGSDRASSSSVCIDERGRLLVLNITSPNCKLMLTILSSAGIFEQGIQIEGLRLSEDYQKIEACQIDRNGILWFALGRTIYVVRILV